MGISPITDDQRRRVTAALEDLSDNSPLTILESPLELHQYMLHYNWDDGLARMQAITTSDSCDRGTALLSYWLSGPFVCTCSTRDECSDYEKELFDCIANIECRLISDRYKNKGIAVDPKNLLFPGDDWTQIVFLRDPPASLIEASPGDSVDEDDLSFELTPKELAMREASSQREDLEALKQMAELDPAYRDNLFAYQRWLAKRNA